MERKQWRARNVIPWEVVNNKPADPFRNVTCLRTDRIASIQIGSERVRRIDASNLGRLEGAGNATISTSRAGGGFKGGRGCPSGVPECQERHYGTVITRSVVDRFEIVRHVARTMSKMSIIPEDLLPRPTSISQLIHPSSVRPSFPKFIPALLSIRQLSSNLVQLFIIRWRLLFLWQLN